MAFDFYHEDATAMAKDYSGLFGDMEKKRTEAAAREQKEADERKEFRANIVQIMQQVVAPAFSETVDAIRSNGYFAQVRDDIAGDSRSIAIEFVPSRDPAPRDRFGTSKFAMTIDNGTCSVRTQREICSPNSSDATGGGSMRLSEITSEAVSRHIDNWVRDVIRINTPGAIR